MKSLFVLPILSLSLLHNSFAETRRGEPVLQPELVSTLPTSVYAPKGFDDNDNAQIILEGYYPNTCYQMQPSDLRVDTKNKKVYIRNQALFEPLLMCAEMIIPYVRTIELGLMPAGQYDLVFDDGVKFKKMSELNVALSPNPKEKDDYYYAPIREVFLKDPHDKVNPILLLRGEYTNTCMKLSRVEVRKQFEQNVVVVLPIMDIDKSGICAEVKQPFQYEISLKDYPKKLLFHVRSLSGEAKNAIVDLN